MSNTLVSKERRRLLRKIPNYFREWAENWSDEEIYMYLKRRKESRKYRLVLPLALWIFNLSMRLLGPSALSVLNYTSNVLEKQKRELGS